VAGSPDGFRDLDITGQWPLWGNWYGVGRYNRNLRDHRLTQGIAGLEYNGGCWVFRGVVQHLTTSATDSTRAFFFQLEFNGAGSIGSSPLNVLKRSVPGYAKINDGSTPFVGDDDDL
jgi:LPS-assembly protein